MEHQVISRCLSLSKKSSISRFTKWGNTLIGCPFHTNECMMQYQVILVSYELFSASCA